MFKNAIFVLAVIGGVGFASSHASANFYVWQDENNDFSFAFPDTWNLQNPEKPDLAVNISSPIMEDRASCDVEAIRDGRLNIYPKAMMEAAVEQYLNKDFWREKLSKYHNAKLTEYYAPSIMGGRGDATAIRYSFSNDAEDEKMYGAMIGSIYGGKMFTVECKALREKFDQYAPLFSRIMESVQLEQRYHPFVTGYYRDFLNDREFDTLTAKPGTIIPKGQFSLRSMWPF